MNIRTRTTRNRDGYATVVMTAILALVLSLTVMNTKILANLSGEIRLIERRQSEALKNNWQDTHANLLPNTVITNDGSE
ncbi:MAG: hypothetical protein M2R45_04786 [Verrucomicrobia subdivision 3 bacterium]|nr:hypothetical protein [Limisphaerales bacterium]MCS1417431.1 hypothetical protein [Limisphaerales bacterium]